MCVCIRDLELKISLHDENNLWRSCNCFKCSHVKNWFRSEIIDLLIIGPQCRWNTRNRNSIYCYFFGTCACLTPLFLGQRMLCCTDCEVHCGETRTKVWNTKHQITQEVVFSDFKSPQLHRLVLSDLQQIAAETSPPAVTFHLYRFWEHWECHGVLL